MRIPESLMVECVCLFVQEEDPYLGIALNTKETLSDFLKMFDKRLAGGLIPYVLVTAQVGS